MEPRVIWTRDVATVWHASLQRDEDELRATLSDAEVKRSLGYRDAADRRRFVVRRGLLRKVLSLSLDVDPAQIAIESDRSGKPFLSASPGYISLAFSRDEAMFGYSARMPIGVDIERIDPE